MSNIFTISNLCRDFNVSDKTIRVLDNINLEIEEGKITFILGPSGAGKSTLLQIIGTLDSPTEGNVLFRSENIHRLSDSKQAKWRNQKIGFIFQFHYLLNEFLAFENVMLPSLFMSSSLSASSKRAKELLSEMGLEERIMHKPNELSGGEQQRVAISRALINDPDVILADEPTGNLDSKNTKGVMELFKKINSDKKKTFIIITHNEELLQYADRVVNMKDGKITD
ncbi:MAG: ABC transporter ATP-binding protein [bacterium]